MSSQPNFKLTNVKYKGNQTFYGYRFLKTAITKSGQSRKYWSSVKYFNIEQLLKGETKKEALKSTFKGVKGQRLLDNIRQVFDAKIDKSKYPQLAEKMLEKLEMMNEEEISEFAEEHKEIIQLYFTYKDSDTSDEIDARFLIMANELGVDVSKESKYTIKDNRTLNRQMHIDYNWVNLKRINKNFKTDGRLEE